MNEDDDEVVVVGGGEGGDFSECGGGTTGHAHMRRVHGREVAKKQSLAQGVSW